MSSQLVDAFVRYQLQTKAGPVHTLTDQADGQRRTPEH